MVFWESMERDSSMSSMSMRSSYNPAMDWMRALASMYVVLFHLNHGDKTQLGIWGSFCLQGWLGVPVFFVISGWCMAMICSRNPNPYFFIQSRITRIILPYWFSIMVVLLAVLFLHFFMGGNNMCRLPHGLKEVLETVTLTTSPVTQRLPLNGVYWSLSMEVVFYFLVSV